jgi:hypothetical protein
VRIAFVGNARLLTPRHSPIIPFTDGARRWHHKTACGASAAFMRSALDGERKEALQMRSRFDPGQTRRRPLCRRLVLEQVHPVPSPRADPAAIAHERLAAEQRRFYRQRIVPRHIASSVNVSITSFKGLRRSMTRTLAPAGSVVQRIFLNRSRSIDSSVDQPSQTPLMSPRRFIALKWRF